MTDQEDKKARTDYMKENPFIELSSQTYRTRRNMLIFSMLCWFQIFYDSQLGGEFSIWGVTLTIPKDHINVILIVFTLYFMVYFFMLGWNTFDHWRLRSTGLKNSEANRPRGSELGMSSVSSPVEQTTFRTIFMDEQQHGLIQAIEKVNEIDPQKLDVDTNNNPNLIALSSLSSNIEAFNRLAGNQLLGFEKGFWKHQYKTYWTFMVFDYFGPITVTCASILILTTCTFQAIAC
ncbi:hypothetical protein [Salidesulfovibrio onnuriiensis]|uniref:hypothetical protein n=1 Tax=Salidesulfovibrio onnuriiensis TaxID=2583823 RepID=UPI0011C8F888|nr:hypothetical protein [Salidesulfovibrio onnuriiensis]